MARCRSFCGIFLIVTSTPFFLKMPASLASVSGAKPVQPEIPIATLGRSCASADGRKNASTATSKAAMSFMVPPGNEDRVDASRGQTLGGEHRACQCREAYKRRASAYLAEPYAAHERATSDAKRGDCIARRSPSTDGRTSAIPLQSWITYRASRTPTIPPYSWRSLLRHI